MTPAELLPLIRTQRSVSVTQIDADLTAAGKAERIKSFTSDALNASRGANVLLIILPIKRRR